MTPGHQRTALRAAPAAQPTSRLTWKARGPSPLPLMPLLARWLGWAWDFGRASPGQARPSQLGQQQETLSAQLGSPGSALR